MCLPKTVAQVHGFATKTLLVKNVGATYSLNFLVLGFVQSSSAGFAIPIAQAKGAGDREEFLRLFWNGAWLSIGLCTLMTALSSSLAGWMLRLLGTPSDIYPEALTYITVIFLGTPATVLYNYTAGVLRAAGDSKRPTIILFASCVLNILLDWLFMAPLGMGVGGAALATVLSQAVSGVLNTICAASLLSGSKGMRGLSWRRIGKIAGIGLPMGVEYSFSAIGAAVMQGAVNSLGTAAVAGQTAGDKIRQFFTLPMESLGMAMATYAGQSEGAGLRGRVRKGIFSGVAMVFACSAACFILIQLLAGFLTSLVLPGGGESAALSESYLRTISLFFPIHGSLMVTRYTLQGMGKSAHAMVSGVGELLGRWLGGALVPVLGFAAISISDPLAWGFGLLWRSLCLVHTFTRKRS